MSMKPDIGVKRCGNIIWNFMLFVKLFEVYKMDNLMFNIWLDLYAPRRDLFDIYYLLTLFCQNPNEYMKFGFVGIVD